MAWMAVGRYLSPPFTIWTFSGSNVMVGSRLNIDTRKIGLSSRARERMDSRADADRPVSR
jgi:hypothetical protein